MGVPVKSILLRRACRAAAVTLAVVVGVVVTAGAGTAATIPTSTPSAGWGVNGNVFATLIVGDTVYVGGTFSDAVSPSGTQVARKNLAAFSLSTGALLTGWRADAGSSVRALASDGTWLYVGGAFGRIGGAVHNRLGRVNLQTGAVDSTFVPSLDNTVRAIALAGPNLYVGGLFLNADGVARNRVAELTTATGSLVSAFNAPANNNVYGLAYDGTRGTLYVAGLFTQLASTARTGVGAVNATTGKITGPAFASSARPTLGLALNDDGSMLYGAGGSATNTMAAWNATTGTRVWHVVTDGDIQAVAYYDGDVYFGFHDGYQGTGTTKLLIANATTGAVSAFRPKFNEFWGVFAIAVSSAGVVAGGEFTTVSGVSTPGFARWLTP